MYTCVYIYIYTYVFILRGNDERVAQDDQRHHVVKRLLVCQLRFPDPPPLHRNRCTFLNSKRRDPNPNKNSLMRKQGCKRRMQSPTFRRFLSH